MSTHEVHYFGFKLNKVTPNHAFQLAGAMPGGLRGRDKVVQGDRHCITWSDPTAMHGTSSVC